MSKNRKYILSIAIVFTCLFTMSFYAFDKYLYNRKEKIEEEHQQTLARESKKNLDNSMIVILYKNDIKEQETTLKELKKNLGVNDDLSEDELTNILSEKGYDLDGIYDKEIIYRREIKDSIEANMYYLGECDGCIAIYTSDEQQNLTITDPQNDIFRVGKKFKDLTKNDQEIIKNRELKFKSKDEAEEKISELIS